MSKHARANYIRHSSINITIRAKKVSSDFCCLGQIFIGRGGEIVKRGRWF
jgi:hypothetical protein